jgi:transketolase
MYETKGPIFMRTAREKTEVLHEKVGDFKFGKAELLKDGHDIALISCGSLVPEAVKAANMLLKEGISASVLNCASIKPLDIKAVEKEASKGIVVTIEDGVVNGLGSAVAEVIAEKGINAKLERIGLKDSFGESGKPFDLLKKYGMDAESIAKKAINKVKER